jgi:4-hydroxy 2-oxovalerate aldolase
MERNIKLLDCTLRDGAHLNEGHFGRKIIEETLADLVEAKVDIIEVGFFDNKEHDDDHTYFSSIAEVKKILPENKGSSMFSLMADFVDVDNVEPCDGTVEIFRLSFKRHRLDWALDSAKKLMEKGYKVYINPVNCNVYTDEQYLQVIKKVNELHPYGFSIVDTFGVMRKPLLSHLYYLAENNLDPDIVIGIHLHENLGLAYSLAQHFLEIANPMRKISIDGSLLGMGRVPGNLCIEQIMDHLNLQYGKNYSTEPAYDAIDDFIAPIKKEIPWGYSLPYALSGKYGLHRTYAEFLLEKKRLKTKDIQRILRLIDKDHIELFDEKYIEGLYRQYVDVEYDDSKDIKDFSKELSGKNIYVVCPGSSISTHKSELIPLTEDENSVFISVNFIPEFFTPDFVFCANAKRLNNIENAQNIKKIITSNLIEKTSLKRDFVFSFNNCVYFNEFFCEDSTLMLLKVLSNCGCNVVNMVGFDGFDRNKQNYFTEKYTMEQGKTISVQTVKQILSTSLDQLTLNFITPSLYED